jgi:hypothetical protein
MSPEVAAMISMRHSAEQRGHLTPLGRLLWMDTEHGRIEFTYKDGVADGPDVARFEGFDGDSNLPDYAGPALLLLGTWSGLPSIRTKKTKAAPCPGDGCQLKAKRVKADCTVCFGRGSIDVAVPCRECLHDCTACDKTGKALCQLCGGSGTIPGQWLPCPGPGCYKDTGQYKAECVTCATSMSRGQIREELRCGMCGGSKKMVCPQCKGARKFSTGRRGGSINWDGPPCDACGGQCSAVEWKQQDIKRFANAALRETKADKREFLVLGPIHTFALMEFESRSPRIYDVTPDSKKDLLNLLVPASPRWKRGRKAYLLGGVVRARGAREAVSA